jgi:hypothetical protein
MKVTRQRASVSTVPSVSWPTPYIGSTITLSPASRIAFRSISFSTASTYSFVKSRRSTMPASRARSSSSLMTSIRLERVGLVLDLRVSSSSSSDPSPRKTLSPFHSGGLWLAVNARPYPDPRAAVA